MGCGFIDFFDGFTLGLLLRRWRFLAAEAGLALAECYITGSGGLFLACGISGNRKCPCLLYHVFSCSGAGREIVWIYGRECNIAALDNDRYLYLHIFIM